MPFRTKNTVTTPKGTYNLKKRTYSGRGPAPVGSRKIKAPTAATAPTVTTSPTGHVTTQNFASPRAAVQAKRQARSSQRRVRRIERQQAAALAFHRRSQQRASQTPGRLPKRVEAPAAAPVRSLTSQETKTQAGRLPRSPQPGPRYKPPKFQGAKTAGTPTVKELRTAKSKGLLRTNRKGYVTTPAVRRVSKALDTARSKGVRLTGPLSPGEKTFAKTVAKETPLKPRTVAAWALQEGGNSTGDYNRLNIGHTDSGPLGLTADPQWSNPKQAGHLTAEFLKGRYGGPSEGIKAILPASKGQPPARQLEAIAGSGWASDPAYAEHLQGTLAMVGQKGKPVPKKLLRRAKELGLAGQGLGPAPKKVVTRFKAIKAAAGALTKRHIPYVWGGGHSSIESAPTGLDCSGAVSWVLNKAGILKTPLTSGSMGEVLKPGPGAVTVFYNGEHTFMKIGNEYWGTSVGDSGAGGLGPHPAPSASYLAQYNVGHVPGLGKKQALQLGFPPTASESFPGMTLSASGTTATVDPSATATRDKPGFSKSPIKLTPNQKAHRTLKKLEQVGAGLSEKPSEGSESKASILASLERRYGKKAA